MTLTSPASGFTNALIVFRDFLLASSLPTGKEGLGAEWKGPVISLKGSVVKVLL